MARVLITLPSAAKRGEIVEIRTLIAHPMETGYRNSNEGKLLPRDLIRRFSCRYGNELVFSAELHAAIAANPYVAFTTVATTSATLNFTWEGDNGFAQTESRQLNVA